MVTLIVTGIPFPESFEPSMVRFLVIDNSDNRVIVSFHKDYSSYDDFRDFTKHAMGESITEMNTFLINLDEEKNTLPPTFLFLSREMTKSKG